MGEYVYTVICAAVCTAIIISLSPDTEGGSLGKYIAFAGAVVMALIMLSPLTTLLKNASSYDFNIAESEVKETAKQKGEYYAESAASVLNGLYGVDRSALSAKITEGEKGELLKITLILEECSFNKKEAEKLLFEIYGIEMEIEEARDG